MINHLQVQTVYHARLDYWDIYLRTTDGAPNKEGWLTIQVKNGFPEIKQWYEPHVLLRCTNEYLPHLVEQLRFIADALQTRLDHSRPIEVNWKETDASGHG